MKRIFSLFLVLILLVTSLPFALADGEPDPIPVIPQDQLSPTPKGIHHYMLICIDSWNAKLKDKWSPSRTDWPNHTDGLILVTVDEYAHRVMLTSFIRDMLIMRPDGKFGRINNFLDGGNLGLDSGGGWAYQNQKNDYEGLQALIDTINGHFDLRIEKYIVVDFQQVENIIDAVGGVDITVTSREASYLKNYSISRSSTTPEMGGAGTYHFTGHAAVIYMRIRKRETAEYLHADGTYHSDTQDYGRTYRDRVVLSSIAESLKDISYQDALKLLDVILANTVYTNMTTDEFLDALDLAMEMRGVPVEHIRMPIDNPVDEKLTRENYSYEEFGYAGMATKQINFVKNREALHEFMLDSFVVVDDE